MSLFFNKYPYTDFHELNLDWLLTSYKHIVDSIEALNNWMSQHKTEYEEALRRLSAVENEIDTFESEINKRFELLDESIHEDFDKLSSDILKDLERTKKQIEQEVADKLIQFENEFNDLKTEVETFISTLRIQIRKMEDEIEQAKADALATTKEYVDARLEAFIQSLPDYEKLIVYNPIRTAYTNVQQAIYDLYDYFRIFSLTAFQYDNLGLTASKYDGYGLSAYDYDTWGYKLLHYPDECCYIRSPFTGQIVPHNEVIYQLADLHRMALTAQQYDNLELEASVYDDMELTAYWYDWYGLELRDAAITAADYDGLQLTALYYDGLELSAILYDRYANALLNNL